MGFFVELFIDREGEEKNKRTKHNLKLITGKMFTLKSSSLNFLSFHTFPNIKNYFFSALQNFLIFHTYKTLCFNDSFPRLCLVGNFYFDDSGMSS